MYHFTLAGTRFRSTREQLVAAQLKIDQSVDLVRDPDNKFDPNAIKVMHGEAHIGFVAREMAKTLAPLMDADRYLVAHIWDRAGKDIIIEVQDSGPDQEAA